MNLLRVVASAFRQLPSLTSIIIVTLVGLLTLSFNSATVAAVGTSATSGPSFSSLIPTLNSSVQSASCSQAISLTSVQTINSAGQVVANLPDQIIANYQQATYATKYTYSLDGSNMTQIIPPTGWSPLTATAQQLATYQFPSRPTDPSALALWQSQYANYQAGAPGMCLSSTYAGLVYNESGYNWSGAMAVNNKAGQALYTSATMYWRQTGFNSAACQNNAAYYTWTGIGGYSDSALGGNGGLMQAGSGADGSNNNSIFAWWEILNPSHFTSAALFTGSMGKIGAGDEMTAFTSYAPSGVEFDVADLTNGQTFIVSMTSYDKEPISYWYDGATADFITEEPMATKTEEDALRKPTLGNTEIVHADPNGNPMSDYRSWNMAEKSIDKGVTYAQTSNFNGSNNDFLDTWHSCY